MRKPATYFEQVPLELVKRIAVAPGSGRNGDANDSVLPTARRREGAPSLLKKSSGLRKGV